MTDSVFVGPSGLKGRITPPPSKSIAHRALIAAALAAGNAQRIEEACGISPALSRDMEATITCLQALFDSPAETAELNCFESGSTLRFLVPVAAALGKTVVFKGEGRLVERPLRDYDAILQDKGVILEFPSGGRSLPLLLRGQLRGGIFKVPGQISSQYITGLLLALPLLAEDSVIKLESCLQSAPYVEITLAVLEQFGIEIEKLYGEGGIVAGWRVPGAQAYQLPPGGFQVEADYSQAAFWLVARFLGHEVEVCGLNPTSQQGDRAIISLLSELAEDTLLGLNIDAGQIPDLVPALAVAASSVHFPVVISNAARLRLKESDRLAALTQELGAIGVNVREGEGHLIIDGGKPLAGGVASAHNDHRIAMALAIAALNSAAGVRIEGAGAVKKSYPDFFRELKRLGGDVRVFNLG